MAFGEILLTYRLIMWRKRVPLLAAVVTCACLDVSSSSAKLSEWLQAEKERKQFELRYGWFKLNNLDEKIIHR